MVNMDPILEGYVQYRDGKKWKRRYCVLCSPSKSLSVLHLYFGKSINDFNAAFRSSQSSIAASSSALGPSTNAANTASTSGSGSKPTVSVFHSLTTRSNYYCNLPHPQSHAYYVADPVTEMCNQAERAMVHDLEAAAGRARSLSCPVPLDTVTGFETGCHLSGESNVVLLIGWKTVHPIALPSVDEMFNWAEVLERALIDSSYHVTLCRVGSASDNTSASSCVLGVGGGSYGVVGGSGGLGGGSGAAASVSASSSTTSGIIPTSTVVVGGGIVTSSVSSSSSSSRLQLGLQASLHVQQWRLCLIGEPSAGCQFIAQWRLDALDAAYTMESSSISGAFSTFGGSAYDPVGGQTFLGFTPPGAQGVFSTSSASYQNDDRFFLEANRAAGKGLTGSYVFQVDGRRLGQLARAIDELMLRRFPALTAPPGTRVLPSTNTDDDSFHLRKSAAIEIRSSSEAGKPLFGASSSSLSPPIGVGGGEGGGIFGSASPHGSGGSFAPSSLPTRGAGVSTVTASAAAVGEMPMVSQPSSSSTSSSRSKKSGHRQFFGGAQTLGRSDAIKIPTRRFTTALSKMTGDGGFSSRGRSSSKTGSGEGSAEGSSSDASSAKPQPPLYFPSVMVGAGIITSLVPAPPPPSQTARSEVFGTSAAPSATATTSLRPKQKSELPPSMVAPPPPPPPPPLHSTSPSSPYCLACERCQRRKRRGHQKTSSADPASISSEDGGVGVGGGGNGGGIFAADEDVEQPVPLPVAECRGLLPPYRGLYNLYKQLYRTVKPFHTNRRLPRSGSFDICAARRRKLVRGRVFEALGGGEGSALDRLLFSISPPLGDITSCVFLLAFSPPFKPPSTDEMDYRWYLVHRPGNCCSRCCLWNTPILLAELNLQDVVAHQIYILSLKEGQKTESLRSIPCGAIPCLSTSQLFVWRFAGAAPFGEMSQCSSHIKSNLLRPWSVLYLGPDSEIDDGTLPVSPAILSFSSSYCCCCYCGSPLSQQRHRSRTQQQPQCQQQQQPNYHAYANLICNTGSSTLPSVSRRNHHHRTAPIAFPGKPSVPCDVPDGHNRRGVFSASSTSCSTSQASSPSSPQGHVSYYNLTSGVGPACLPPNPLKYPFHEERPSGAYANLQHLYASLNLQQNRWRIPCSVRAPASAAVAEQIPDEIREPKRNYALVDLRPSPASSVIAPGDTITFVSTSEDTFSTATDGGAAGGVGATSGGGGSGSRTDSSASTLHTNTSTSSSAATFVPGNGGNRPRTASQFRRTSSHSLTAVLPVPTLNYVHIMTKRDAKAAVAGAAGCESPLSSSTATSSTTSSSDKEQRAPAAVLLNITTPTALASPAEQIPYAQIDFERTRALNAVNGAGEVNHPHGHHFHRFRQHKAATNALTAPFSGAKPSIVSGCGGLRGLSTRKKSDGW